MALNIEDRETERLAAEAAALIGDTKPGAIRQALREFIERRSGPTDAQAREQRLRRFLEDEIWPLFPADRLGQPQSKSEQEELLGIGPDGV